MAHVSGPVSTLPGHTSRIENVECDNHPGVPAVRRIQGETDSFGAEYHDQCAACVERSRSEKVDRSGTCDWCKAFSNLLVPRRDFEEGSCGRVYDVCLPCITKENERLKDELDELDDLDYY